MELVCSNKFNRLIVFVLCILGVSVRKQEESMSVYRLFVLKHDFKCISEEMLLQEHPLSSQDSIYAVFLENSGSLIHDN